MADDRTALDVLIDISDTLHALLALSKARTAKHAPEQLVASPDQLDGKWGDPVLKARDPREWTGEPMTGKKMSECPPDYLSMLASRHDYFAEKAAEKNELASNGKPKADYERRSAALARGWAARIRSGWKPPQSSFEDQQETIGNDWPSNDNF